MDKQVTRCGRHIIKDDITLLRDARRRVIGYVYMSFHGSDVYVKESLRFSCLYYIIREETFSTNVTHLILEKRVQNKLMQ